MDALLNDIQSSIKKYFDSLTYFGYKSPGEVNKLLAYIFLGDLLTGFLRYYITEEDYQDIQKALSCLYGSSCLIPYPEFINDDGLFEHLNDSSLAVVRISENTDIRYTEDIRTRITN